MKEKLDNKVDIIIPAYRAQKTILRTLSSIACQTILKDLEVIIVNDDPSGKDYSNYVEMFSPYFKVKEVKMEKNGGPGLARQRGIDEGEHEFFTCIDADDTFAGAMALDIMRESFNNRPEVQCASGTFFQLGETLQQIAPHQQDMVWMFGKMYRRAFINKYKIHFNETRANEDTGFNTWVRLLCNNPNEQIRFFNEVVYYWHNKKNSITRINDGQYALDQCFCGWTDNMIYAIQNVIKLRPFDGGVRQWAASIIIRLYYYWIETVAKKPVFADQNWEYVKKYYNAIYKKMEDDISDQALSELYSIGTMETWQNPAMIGVIPCMGIKEFLNKLREEKYDPDHIYDVWEKIPEDLVKNNEECGVCPVGYTKRPMYADKDKEKVFTPIDNFENAEEEEVSEDNDNDTAE